MTTHKHNTDVETALRLALEALKDNQHLIADNERYAYVMEYNAIIEKCKEALAQPEQEPDKYLMDIECTKCGAKQSGVLTVNTTPPQRTWVGLTDEEYLEAESVVWVTINLDSDEKEANREFYKAIEAKLKEKNT